MIESVYDVIKRRTKTSNKNKHKTLRSGISLSTFAVIFSGENILYVMNKQIYVERRVLAHQRVYACMVWKEK